MYLDHWKKTVDDRNDCEDDDKKHMVLSRVTDRGIRMTGMCLFVTIDYYLPIIF